MSHIVIVGAGPVGLSLALDLAWRGQRSIILEKTSGEISQPRMDLVSVRTMEFCRRWGLVPDIEASPFPRDLPQDIAYVTSVTGYELGRESKPSMAGEKLPPYSPQKRERCPQNFFDPILRSAVQDSGLSEIRFHTEFTGYRETRDGLEIAFRQTQTGEEGTVPASYLIGCDGGTSSVRRHAGIELEGNPVLTNSTNILFRSEHLRRLVDGHAAYRYVLLDPAGLWATLVAINGCDVWRLQIIGARDANLLAGIDVDAAIRRAVGCDFDYEILSVLPWRRRELVAEHFRKGRVFLAGDSAHQMSPTGGFGMNTGIADAVDLSWKLDACLRGWGGELLLGSYEDERKPVALRNVSEASSNLARMLSITGDDRLLDSGAAGDEVRARTGHAVSAAMQREWGAIGIHIGYVYRDSPVCSWTAAAAPDRVTDYVQSSRPGGRAPHVWIGDGRSTLDLFGQGFVLIRTDPNVSPEPLVAAACHQKIPFRVETLTRPDVTSAYEAALVLVRPDGHVAWRGDLPPENADVLMSRVAGRP